MSRLKSFKLVVCGAIVELSLLITGTAWGAEPPVILWESYSSLGVAISPTSGNGISSTQFLASRFNLSQDSEITAVGGNLFDLDGGGFFAAIIAAPPAPTLPSFSPSDIEGYALASTVFMAPVSSNDILTPLSVFLPAGDYALVFGSGLFGALGSGGAAQLRGGDWGGNSIFYSRGLENYWADSGGSGTPVRFVVQGFGPEFSYASYIAPIPEPEIYAMLGMGLGLLGWVGRGKKLQAA